MTLWVVFALMTAAAVAAVLWPIGRARAQRSGEEVAVYRDQLDEIERDFASGRIGAPEAEAARIEVSRRLLGAVEAMDRTAPEPSPAQAQARRRVSAATALLLLPLGAGALYAALGSPGLPSHPKVVSSEPAQPNSLQEAVAQVEALLAKNPNDGQGWEVIAPFYLQQGRFADAVKARRNALTLLGETAERQSSLGEALVFGSNGIVTADAKAAFERAVALDRDELKSLTYLGLAAEQDGKPAEASAIWRGILAKVPPNAPIRQALSKALARVEGTAIGGSGGPRPEDVEAAKNLSDNDREEMVRGMVARLAERLKQDSSDLEGWLRLVRAYTVMGDQERALGAAGDARKALGSTPDKLAKLNEVLKGLGLPE